MKPVVVVLHGINRSAAMMEKMASAIASVGYEVLNISYPSTKLSISDCVDWVYTEVSEFFLRKSPLHVVGHSMGGLIIRQLLSRYRPSIMGRVILLGTPNQGSPVADFLQKFALYRWWFGPAGSELGTKDTGVAKALPPVDYECGVIAGTKSTDFFFSRCLLDGQNDGKVSVESVMVEGMKGHLVLPVTHAGMVKDPDVIQAVIRFLNTGCF